MLHTVGGRGLSRGGSVVRRLPVQDLGGLRCRVLEKVGVSNSGRQSMLDRRPFRIDGSGGDNPERSEPVAGKDVNIEDFRTCWIDTAESGSRFKPRRNVVLESTQETFSDSVVTGPATALPVLSETAPKR